MDETLSNAKLHALNAPLSIPGNMEADPGNGVLVTLVENIPAHSLSAPPSLPYRRPPKRTRPRASEWAASKRTRPRASE
jgi:hypothetical protein